MRQTDVADQQQLFRLIQSIPSPKAEPFKQWIAKVASERGSNAHVFHIGKFCCVITKIAGLSSELAKVYQ